MQNFNTFIQDYARRSGNRIMEYSANIYIISIRLEDGRQQQISAYIVTRGEEKIVEFMSKVCDLEKELDYKELLGFNQQLCCYSKVLIYGGMLQVAASARYDLTDEEQMVCMMEEVARVADSLEMELTGQDVY